MLTFGSLFAGIGGFDLGLERAGMACAWQVEREPYAARVLEKHWPNVRRHDDVCTFPPEEGNWAVDLICGGFPCQDISVAGKGQALPVSGPVFGTRCTGSLASYDRDTSSWKTSQRCFLEGWIPYSQTFPRSGMTRNGTLFRLVPLVPRTGGNGSGLWPTPDTGESLSGHGRRGISRNPRHQSANSLEARVRQWPTPTVQDASNNGGPSQSQRNTPPLNSVAGGALNPQWVEWLMGFPIGWTDCEDSATP